MSEAQPLTPDPVEISAGTVLGYQLDARPLGRSEHRGLGLRAAIEHELLEALRCPPCAVAFSGGRDSSAILCLAAALARREGLEPPVAVTMAFPGMAEADEERWQRLVLEAAAVADWERVELDGAEMDFIGPVAERVIRRLGVVYPANAHLMRRLIETMSGGTFVMGLGGDELFGYDAHPILRTIRYRRRPTRALARSLPTFVPARFRWRALLDDVLTWTPWLTERGREAVEARVRGTDLPLRWDAAIRKWVTHRYVVAGQHAYTNLGTDLGVTVASPFESRLVMAAAAAERGWAGFESRTAAMAQYFGDVLPAEVASRRSKATFNAAVRSEPSRAFSADWSGDRVDHTLVDVERLRADWLSDGPPMSSGLLIQQAALGLRAPR